MVVDSATGPSSRVQAVNLFLTGFLVLFLELACIRWFGANVIFMQFFTNAVLLAAFLGMSCGCLASKSSRDWLALFPFLALVTILTALAMLAAYLEWTGLAFDVGHQAAPQEIFFGTEYRDADLAQFTLPIEAIIAVFFVLIALMFVGLGQVLGRAFDAYPNRVMGYTYNIGGSLVGIVMFSFMSFVRASPLFWFAIVSMGMAYLLHQSGRLSRARLLVLVVLPLLVMLPPLYKHKTKGVETAWSPYYSVEYDPDRRLITVDNIGHQEITPYLVGGPHYSLIHLLQKAAGGKPFEDALIIGAGSGNDVDRAIRYGVKHVDAVEIDPVIRNIGITKNPDAPYSDPRVASYLDDGRHFLRTNDHKYDLVVYALLDSLILHSSYANIRLESYLFTLEAMADVKKALRPDGVFVTYNYFRQGWVVDRLSAMIESVFGCKPVVLSVPNGEEIPSWQQPGFTTIITSCDPRIAEAFSKHPNFWMNRWPVRNVGIDGFAQSPENWSDSERAAWLRLTPASASPEAEKPRFATDDWPFLYLQDRLIPDFNVRSTLSLGALGLAMILFFMPKGRGRLRFDPRMFFLGAAFMLLETKAVVELALLFGSTWMVNSLVFFTALVLILLANLYVLKSKREGLGIHYLCLLALLLTAIFIPMDVFLGGNIFWRYVLPSALALGPMFFAGVIFSRSFKATTDADMSYGSNIAGCVVGGLCEMFSMLVGFKYLLVLAIAFYLLSMWTPIRSPKQA
jgi:SAM-dependent methyltransferase